MDYQKVGWTLLFPALILSTVQIQLFLNSKFLYCSKLSKFLCCRKIWFNYSLKMFPYTRKPCPSSLWTNAKCNLCKTYNSLSFHSLFKHVLPFRSLSADTPTNLISFVLPTKEHLFSTHTWGSWRRFQHVYNLPKII